MKQGLKLFISESLAFRNANLPVQITMEQFAVIILPNMKPKYAIKTLSCWNNGVYTPIPTPEDISRIAHYCGVNNDYVLGATAIPAREMLNEEFYGQFYAMVDLLKSHYNEDENPVLKKSVELWKRLNPNYSN